MNLDFLQNIDISLFYFINVTLSNSLTDRLMPFITERNHWFIFYALIWLYLVFKGGARGRVAAILIIPLILLADQFSDNILKQLFHRTRPCHDLRDVHTLINCSESYSFPSNHAVNNFAAASLFSNFYPEMKFFLFTGAFIVSISRVMCGVHYPSDVLAGAVTGIFFALFIIYLWKFVNGRFKILL